MLSWISPLTSPPSASSLPIPCGYTLRALKIHLRFSVRPSLRFTTHLSFFFFKFDVADFGGGLKETAAHGQTAARKGLVGNTDGIIICVLMVHE